MSQSSPAQESVNVNEQHTWLNKLFMTTIHDVRMKDRMLLDHKPSAGVYFESRSEKCDILVQLSLEDGCFVFNSFHIVAHYFLCEG